MKATPPPTGVSVPAPDALRVLLVDDEALARLRLRTLLGDCTAPPAVVTGEAEDAQQALIALRHARQMRNGDGFVIGVGNAFHEAVREMAKLAR